VEADEVAARQELAELEALGAELGDQRRLGGAAVGVGDPDPEGAGAAGDAAADRRAGRGRA